MLKSAGTPNRASCFISRKT